MIQYFFKTIQKKGLLISDETKKVIENGKKFLVDEEDYKSSIQFKIKGPGFLNDSASGWIKFQRTKFNVYGVPEFSESRTYYLCDGTCSELRVLNIEEKRVNLGVYNDKKKNRF